MAHAGLCNVKVPTIKVFAPHLARLCHVQLSCHRGPESGGGPRISGQTTRGRSRARNRTALFAREYTNLARAPRSGLLGPGRGGAASGAGLETAVLREGGIGDEGAKEDEKV